MTSRPHPKVWGFLPGGAGEGVGGGGTWQHRLGAYVSPYTGSHPKALRVRLPCFEMVRLAPQGKPPLAMADRTKVLSPGWEVRYW